MLDSSFNKLLLLILGLIQTHDQRHAKLLKDGHIVIRSEATIFVSHVLGTREGDELSWNDPVEISILDLLEMLILLHIEARVVVPAQFHGIFKPS